MINMKESISSSLEHRAFILERELNFAHREIEQLNKVTRMHRDLIKFMEKGLREKFKKIEEKINV